ncbi:MAG: 50S ribosomal protein L10 [Candidatus Harrisonbacteria bacterium CG10_big_fil_rev_8_21_14_0_10_38_8]|uniref:Large ribosomal subunit protein uL10 n=1 Tax=Candidatus Harrisonbacteria bacterium CG10_big_fil_rev_8_21_14_0_10_38_8 TaxID=1974582 RepID=A0A2M6WKV2_9BACT|nr:MAG: 50S ribosomal protein L10 [Candidatus Harrisonbacteria bacterium CG10_big_fil_rev_8_21_14_0_10_38_8]
MLTKEQKKQQVALGGQLIKDSQTLIFIDFTGASVEEVKEFKATLRDLGGKFKVIKKRLLNISLKEAGVEFDPLTTTSPVGTVFGTGELTTVAKTVDEFVTTLKKRGLSVTVLGAYDGQNKRVLASDEFTIIAKLPSRDVLLAQTAGTFAAPITAFMYILNQLAEKKGGVVEETPVVEEKKEEVLEKSEEVQVETAEETPAVEEKA